MQSNPPVDLDVFRENLLKYTRKAFRMLPKIEKPHILDIGCGSGLPTLELARLSNGTIIGIDIDQSELDKLIAKISDAHLTARIKAMNCSLHAMDFPEESFDIIWAEGSISAIGFDECLVAWYRFIKPNRFLVVHDAAGDLVRKLRIIPELNYHLIDHFVISGETWWKEYYCPLQEHINSIREDMENDSSMRVFLDKQQLEIEQFNKNRAANGSVFIVMQKKTNSAI